MGSDTQRDALLARVDSLELDVADRRRRVAKLMGLPEPLGLRARGPAKDALRVRIETAIDHPVADAAIEPFVAALQSQTSSVAFVSVKPEEIVCRAVGLELRVLRDDDGATLRIDADVDPTAHTHRMQIITFASFLAMPAVLAAFALPAYWLLVPIAAFFGSAIALSRMLSARRRAAREAALEALREALTRELETAPEAAHAVSR